ncbi:hypothetical protein [Actinosynnema sp. NPDC020468]|uniref:hypothetical protein n=1 Tax=Actinosynnema sp. NPDC020468 TaxID=3154488 RepID=UPI00340BE248
MGGELDDPLPARRDPEPEPDLTGLRGFNIGLVPASVTPPRTWRRAAWFAVLSSAGVLVGLAVVASQLVGTSRPSEHVALPNYPTDVPLLTNFAPATSAAPAASSTVVAPPSTAVVPQVLAGGDAGERGGAAVERTPGEVVPPGAGTTVPKVTTVPNTVPPVVDGAAIASRTERFYEQLATNSGTAFALTTDVFRSTAEPLLAGRFGDVSLIEVKSIAVDPVQGITVSTLEVTRKDGTTSTQRRELIFTTTGDPLINAERLTGGT